MKLAILITKHLHQYEFTVDELLELITVTVNIQDNDGDLEYLAAWVYRNLPISFEGSYRIARELIALKEQL